ncbi:MAG TPA: trypsin-like peptidase domain-containing protein, partial [Rectinemataceae bacterium]|nr:trypsin-like peptidase domain-containing protein [Rectinemataceae bacterium]
KPRELTQKDIDKAVEYSLEQRPAPPSNASLAFAAVREAVVRIRQLQGEGAKEQEIGVGTGVVVNEEGLIITNNHVIAGAPRLDVTFSDGSESPAQVVSADPDRDLALVKADQSPDELKPATLRSTAGLKVGDEVFAVGFPFGIGPSLSAGVVSGLDRSYVSPARGKVLTGLIQVDAAANPGNSGGPLVDRQGDVVGLVTSILNPSEQRVFIGIAFAVPFDQAMRGFGLNPF